MVIAIADDSGCPMFRTMWSQRSTSDADIPPTLFLNGRTPEALIAGNRTFASVRGRSCTRLRGGRAEPVARVSYRATPAGDGRAREPPRARRSTDYEPVARTSIPWRFELIRVLNPSASCEFEIRCVQQLGGENGASSLERHDLR